MAAFPEANFCVNGNLKNITQTWELSTVSFKATLLSQ
jgi:hypothetical protein